MNGVSAISSNKIVLAWDGVQGIRYGVQASTNLSGAWTNDNPLPLSGTGADAITYTSTVDSASQPAHFFRITVP